MPAYVVVQITVEDPVRYAEYRRIAPPSIAVHGGRYIVRGGACEILEGSWLPPRLVVLEFPTVERARAWWASPEYAPAKALRQQSGQSTARSELDHISSTGRYVVFRTLATNLGSLPDTNKDYDLYVRDREAGSTRRVSVGLGDRSPNERSILGFASTNGTVLFDSHASNIVAGDTNGEPDTFVRAPAP